MKNKIDLEKIFNNVDSNKSTVSVAFKSEDINFDLESIKEALKVSDKIFLQMGYFEYDKVSFDEPCFIFDGFCPVIEFFGGSNEDETVEYLEYEYDEDMKYDEYYDKYKSDDSGYGIYIDKDLNVEYGYYTEEYSNGKFHKVFHDFEDARDDDEVKTEIFTILANADIWITADVSIDDFHNRCDLEKLDKLINWENVSIFGSIDGKNPVSLGNLDLPSFKEALNNYDKIFLEIGDFSYSIEDSDILIDAHSGWLTNYDTISDIESGYYDKYKSEIGGYGFYLDKDLNVEYGWYTEEYSFQDNKNYAVFHDFEDARDDDEVKNKIYSILDKLDIWNPYEVSSFPKDKMYCTNCGKRYNADEKLCPNCRTKLITATLVNEKIQAAQEIKTNQIKELSELLDDILVRLLAKRSIFFGWTTDSKETLLSKMLKQYSFNEIIKMSEIYLKDETCMLFIKSFNKLDDKSAREFYECTTDYSSLQDKIFLLADLLEGYPINELYEKLMSFKSLDN